MIVHTSAWDIEIKVRDFPDLNLSSFEVTVSLTFVKTHGNWITAMMIIADCSRKSKDSANNSHILAQSQLYDLLVVIPKLIKKDKL